MASVLWWLTEWARMNTPMKGRPRKWVSKIEVTFSAISGTGVSSRKSSRQSRTPSGTWTGLPVRTCHRRESGRRSRPARVSSV